jgi:hypothetical protein
MQNYQINFTEEERAILMGTLLADSTIQVRGNSFRLKKRKIISLKKNKIILLKKEKILIK